MTTILSSPARPLDPRDEGIQRRLVSYGPDDHAALVERTGCDHPPMSDAAGRVWYEWCGKCRAQREHELAEAGR